MEDNNQTPAQPQTPPVPEVQTPQTTPSQSPSSPQSPQSTLRQTPSPEASTPEVTPQSPVEPEKPKSNKTLLFGVALLLIAIVGVVAYLFFQSQSNPAPQPTTYEECIEAEGSVIQKSYPPICVTKDGKQFTQPISPTPTQQLSPSVTSPPDSISNWKTYSTSTYTFKYPSDVELKEFEGSTVALSKWGPTQKADTEFYDGISLSFMPREIPSTTLKDYVQTQIDEITAAGLVEIISGLTPVTVNKYSGLTYTTEGLGIHKTIVIQTDDGVMFMEITNSTADPGNLGFAETVDQILSTFEFIE